jgi:hypothetical protein
MAIIDYFKQVYGVLMPRPVSYPSPNQCRFWPIAFLAFMALSCVSSGSLFEKQMTTQKDAARETHGSSSASSKKETVPKKGDEIENAPKMKVEGSPENASVFIDGEYVGLSPLTLRLLPGFHSIRIAQEGYRDVEMPVSWNGNESETISYRLEPVTGKVMLTLEPHDAETSLDDRGIVTNGLNEIPIGRHSIRVSRFGFEPKRVEFEVSENEAISLRVSLEQTGLSLKTILGRKSFNPRDAGPLGRFLIKALPNSYGYARIRITAPDGLVMRESRSVFIDSEIALRLEWDGCTPEGAYCPVGDYQAVFEAWTEALPLNNGDFPDRGPDFSRIERISISSEFQLFSEMLSGISGLSYCPDAELLKDAVQWSFSLQGSYVSESLWIAQALVNGRAGLGSMHAEGNSVFGAVIFPGMAPRLVFGLGAKMKLWNETKGIGRSLGAYYLKANFFSEDIVIDPFGTLRGIAAGLPTEWGFGILDLDICPEITFSPYAQNRPDSVEADIFSTRWYVIPYLRGGLRISYGDGQIGLSSFCRLTPLGQLPFGIDLPFGVAGEGRWTDRKTGMRYGLSVLGQFQSAKDYYLMAGLTIGGILPAID